MDFEEMCVCLCVSVWCVCGVVGVCDVVCVCVCGSRENLSEQNWQILND